ncbi:MAG TPA: site-specific integrase, partial [Pirellulaceae bacterium]
MQDTIDRFLRYLRVERNASPLTIKSYAEDLAALNEYLRGEGDQGPSVDSITTLELRDYMAAVSEAGYAKSTISRRMASLRSFFRFAQREETASHNPAKPLRNPRKPRPLPHFLTSLELGQLLQAPPA